MTYRIWIPGKPLPWKRPRPAFNGHWYSPSKSRPWRKTLILLLGIRATRPPVPTISAISLTLRFYMPRPQRLKGEAQWCPKRPDIDNLAKEVIDAMMDAQWMADDGQVVGLYVSKQYPSKDRAPGVEIVMEDLCPIKSPTSSPPPTTQESSARNASPPSGSPCGNSET